MKYTGFFDSHAHYDDPAFDEDRPEVLKKIKNVGVDTVVNIGADLASSIRSVDLASSQSGFYASVGIHPHEAKNYNQETENTLLELTKKPKVVAIGEIGLDYHYDYSPRDIQKKVFSKQLNLAQKTNLPVVIHSRDALLDTMEILKTASFDAAVIHSFSGSAEVATEYLNLGLYLGFTGLVTFKNVRKVLEALETIPIDRILLETDCPYMAPVPYRGERCDGSMLEKIAEKIAEIKKIPVEEIIFQTAENARKFYKI